MPNDAYFQGNPVKLDTSRSKMKAAPRWTGSWNVGELIPIFATSSIMPGDTFSMSVSSAIRLITPRFPTMDDLDITIEAYFVPHRLILSRKSMSPDVNDSNHSWEAFIGAQDSLLNMPTPGDVKLPRMLVTNSGYVVGGLADCLGFPSPTSSGYAVNCLKILAYASIWNEYFREPNVQSAVTFSINSYGDIALYGQDAGIAASGTFQVSDLPLFPVSRYHGYFGSALPWPQRNTTSVLLPLGNDAPVLAGTVEHLDIGDDANPLLFRNIDSSGHAATVVGGPLGQAGGLSVNGNGSFTATGKVTPSNLYADLSQATAATINQLRTAFQTQKWYEHLARCGNKYSDLVSGMFGVRDGRDMSRPEYLGGFTAPINISQVANTSSDVGQTGAFSLSNPGGFLFTKSFTEHGTLMVVACVRCKDSFTQGIQCEDTRFERFDFYWPEFANLGEKKILEKELYVTGNTGINADDAVFGYQEAWAEYRYFVDQVRGYANPVLGNSGLEYLTYANNFASAPTLKGFLNAKGQVPLVDRSMTVTSAAAGFQFVGQFGYDITMIRPMPLYSVPGLIDHH